MVHRELTYEEDDKMMHIASTMMRDLRCATIRRVDYPDDKPDVASIKNLLSYMDSENRQLGSVVILGSPSDGALNELFDIHYGKRSLTKYIRSFLWWNNHERPGLVYYSPRVQIETEDVATSKPSKCNLLVCNVVQSDKTLELKNLSIVERWLKFKPERFIIRITNFASNVLENQLRRMEALYDGHFIALAGGAFGKPKVEEVYLVSVRQVELRELKSLGPGPDTYTNKPIKVPEWPIPNGELPVDHLAPLDMSATIEGHKRPLFKPRGGTKFLKEIGWYPQEYSSSESVYRDPTFEFFTKDIHNLIEDFDKWELTKNNIENITKALHQKIDRPPIENHDYLKIIWRCYAGLANYLRARGFRMAKMGYEEVGKSVRKGSCMGQQDRELGYANMGDYVSETGNFKQNVMEFRRALISGRPIKGDFYVSVKREARKDDKIRLVFSLCATARIFEAMVFGDLDKMLKLIPFSARKHSNFNYGQVLYEIMNPQSKNTGAKRLPKRNAVCDDISGWDSRISYSILCMEAAFLKHLADDKIHQQEIESLYRLYAFAMINVPRDGPYGEENVLYQLQGQAISGRRVTYAMNTITNIVICLARAATSQSVPYDKLSDWVFERMLEEHDNKFGGLVSGDDSVIIMSYSNARKYAQNVDILNAMGFERKATGLSTSRIIYRHDVISFCNRNFVPVDFGDRVIVRRYLPTKMVDEIIMRKLLHEKEHKLRYSSVWAREQARALMVDYFHCRTIWNLASAILQATSRESEFGSRGGKRWPELHGGSGGGLSILDIVNERVFLEKAHSEAPIHLRRLVRSMKSKYAAIYDLYVRNDDEIYLAWLAARPFAIEKFREMLDQPRAQMEDVVYALCATCEASHVTLPSSNSERETINGTPYQGSIIKRAAMRLTIDDHDDDEEEEEVFVEEEEEEEESSEDKYFYISYTIG